MLYFPLLDALRFLAALGVMCFHYFSGSIAPLPAGSFTLNPFSLFITYGYLGVQLFFIISGFVIHFSLHRPTREYVIGRFVRIYPLFWVLCTFTYAATLIFAHSTALSFTTFLKNLLIINNGQTAFMVDGSYWTLTIELLFYAYIGFFVWFLSTKKLEWFYGGWLVCCLAIFCMHADGFLISKLLLVRYAPYFIFGGTIGLVMESWKTAGAGKKVRLALIVFVSACAPFFISHVLQSEYSVFTNNFGVLTTKSSALIVESFFFLVPAALYLSYYIPKGGWITFAKALGGITYPLYLIHQRLGQIIIEAFGAYGAITVYSVLTAGGMILASYVISRYEEVYRKKLLKKMTRSKDPEKASVAAI